MFTCMFWFGMGYLAAYVKSKFGYSIGLKLKKVESVVKESLEK